MIIKALQILQITVLSHFHLIQKPRFHCYRDSIVERINPQIFFINTCIKTWCIDPPPVFDS